MDKHLCLSTDVASEQQEKIIEKLFSVCVVTALDVQPVNEVDG